MRKRVVIGNWKMHGDKASAAALAHAIRETSNTFRNIETAVCPPYIYLPMVAEILRHSSVTWGAQNVAAYETGAYTGEISASMLRDFQCKYVIIGHSERRQLFNETNEIIVQKSLLAITYGVIPIICVGEMLAEREQGQTENIIAKQLEPILKNIYSLSFEARKQIQPIIAYEPVWAIGTGKTATPEQAQLVHAFIRSKIKEMDKKLAETTSIIYGGSVKKNNAKDLFAMPDIDGGLLGGASLKADEFLEICQCG